MKGYSKKNYLEAKKELICACASGKMPTMQQVEIIRMLGGKWAENDLDLVWLKIDIKTKHFTKKMSSKKANALYAETQQGNLAAATSYSIASLKLYHSYLDFCNQAGRRSKTTKIVCAVTACLVLIFGAVGVWYGDHTGFFYGNGDLTFTANGATISQNALRYNSNAVVNIPKKAGYDVGGIIDNNSGKLMFDKAGVALNKTSSRDLSDYSKCDLEVVYSPHVYTASVKNFGGVALCAFTYTVEDKPEDVIDEPQFLEGYVFDGWFTDSKFKKPFTGNFMDYADENQPLVLYPHYSLDGWSLTWQLNGGEFKTNVVDTYTILSDVHLPDEDMIAREGYELEGWTLDGKKIGYFTPTIMKDSVLSAIWKPIQYKITYELNGGLLGEAEAVFTVEDEFILENPIKPGYIFEGWYANKLFTKSVETVEQGSVGDRTVFAKWSPIQYSVLYKLNGGENSPLNPISYTADKNITLQNPQRTGYTFCGWLCGNEKVTELEAVVNGSVELTALWKADEFTMTIVPNNDDNVYIKTVYYDEEYSIDQPLRKGYEFDGFTVDGEFINKQGVYRYTKNITVYANYTPIVYAIKYNLNGGEQCSFNPTLYSAEKSVKLQAPNRIGYSFEGWFIDGEAVTELNAAIYGNANLVAAWKANDYVVTVNPNNGGEIYSLSVCYDNYYSIVEPTRKGYTFIGFSMSGVPIDSVGQYLFTSNIFVIANFRANQYTISYVSDAVTVSTQQVTFDDRYTLYSPKEKLNHEFAGWFDKVVGGNRVFDGVYRIDGDTVLYASWIRVIKINLANDMDFTIDSALDKVYIIGNYNGNENYMTNVNIKIAARCYDLTIELVNAGFKASADNSAICAESDGFLLTVNAVGVCYVCGGDGSASINSAVKSNNGKSAIEAPRLILISERATSFKLQGGNGADGCRGADGAKESTGLVWCNWGWSGSNGGVGGDSGAAIRVMTYTNYSNVELIEGTAGVGGDGGSAGYRAGWFAKTYGSDGSKGNDGTVVSMIQYESVWV